MTTRTDEAKATILEAAVSRARALSGTDADDVERWVRTYYAHVAPEDLADRTDADLAGAALAHWGLAQQRRPGELKLRVYNPNVEEHGWESPHTVAEFVNDDMPFLVDSISMEITRHGSGIHLMIRPIVRMRRDDEGNLEEIVDEGGIRESTIHVEIDKQTDPQALAELHDDLVRVLADVHAAVADWPAMLEEVREIAEDFAQHPPPVDPEELSETIDLLEWMRENFTFLGYREYEIAEEDGEEVLRAVSGSGLGILRQKGEAPISASFARLPPDVRRMARHKHLLNLTKANSRATVHRPAYLDYVGVKRFDATRRGRRRAALPRPLHAHRVQRDALGDPRDPAQGAPRRRTLWAPVRWPRLQGARRHHRDVPARRAAADVRGRPLRDRDGDLPARRAPPSPPVRPPRQLRPLPLVPRLHPARPVQHAQSRADRGDPRPRAAR